MRSRPRPRLTDRQAAVLDAIRQVLERDGRPPTIRELGEALGLTSTNAVNDHLKALERKGYVAREPRMSRTLRVLEQTDAAAVVEALEQRRGFAVRTGARLPVGRFTPGELAEILARCHPDINYGNGVVTIGVRDDP